MAKKIPEITYLLDKIPQALHTAHMFGFTPIETPKQYKGTKKESELLLSRLSYLSFYLENGLHKKQPPLLFAYELPLVGSGKRKNNKMIDITLEATGSVQSICEAIAIKTAFALITDEGHKDAFVEINSIGDKESFTKYERDISAYFRKNINALPATLRQSFKKDIWNILRTTDSRAEEFLTNAPQSMNCLSDTSRKHFKEVLEYLETLGIPYKINPALLGENGVSAHTICEIKIPGKAKKVAQVLATGTRYNGISKHIGHRKDLPGFVLELHIPTKKVQKTVTLSKTKKAALFFIQLGFEARLQSLNVIELLRKNKIGIGHALTRDKITAQMIFAERASADHLIIMGQREAIEKSVVIRETETRAQKSIPLSNLISTIKSLKKPKSA